MAPLFSAETILPAYKPVALSGYQGGDERQEEDNEYSEHGYFHCGTVCRVHKIVAKVVVSGRRINPVYRLNIFHAIPFCSYYAGCDWRPLPDGR